MGSVLGWLGGGARGPLPPESLEQQRQHKSVWPRCSWACRQPSASSTLHQDNTSLLRAQQYKQYPRPTPHHSLVGLLEQRGSLGLAPRHAALPERGDDVGVLLRGGGVPRLHHRVIHHRRLATGGGCAGGVGRGVTWMEGANPSPLPSCARAELGLLCGSCCVLQRGHARPTQPCPAALHTRPVPASRHAPAPPAPTHPFDPHSRTAQKRPTCTHCPAVW